MYGQRQDGMLMAEYCSAQVAAVLQLSVHAAAAAAAAIRRWR